MMINLDVSHHVAKQILILFVCCVEVWWLYPRFAGGERVAPHDRGPGTEDLIGTGDDNHRQGGGLDQQGRRRPFMNCLTAIFLWLNNCSSNSAFSSAKERTEIEMPLTVISVTLSHLDVTLQSSMLKLRHKLNDVEFFSDSQTTLMKKTETWF